MQRESDFLGLIQTHPLDFDLLLIYADWLEERGEVAKASFLQEQHRIQQMRPHQRGIVGVSRNLARLGASLPRDWVRLVSRPVLVGTCWSGYDSEGQFYVFRYLEKGILNYTSPIGTFQNATWHQIGNVVYMEMNRHYADYQGIVHQNRIRGRASNVMRNRWRWDVTLTIDPELCDPGDPVTIVYDGHLRSGRRRRRRSFDP